MKATLTRFIRSLVIFSAILALVAAILLFIAPSILSPATPWLLVLFVVVTFVVFYLSVKAGSEKFGKFVNYYMVMSMLKLFVLLIITGIYVYLNRADAIRFAVTLLILFFGYLIFEVVWLLKLKEK
ncbi:MAG TPA: hypothetical protein PLP88_04795 [Bacteroidales bacterium]|nr:hypothetical protein [Bacteroidales bacterium]